MHSGQFCWFSKTCHFSNIRCFLKLFFKQISSNVTPRTFLPHFWRFQFLIQTDHFAKPMVFALWQNGHFAKAVVRQHWLTLELNFKERKSCKKSQHTKEIFYGKNGSKKHLQSGKTSHFAKTTATQNGQRWSILSLNFKVPKIYKRNSVYNKRYSYSIQYNKRLKNTHIFQIWHFFEKWQKWLFCTGYAW